MNSSYITQEFEIIEKYSNFSFKCDAVDKSKLPKAKDFDLYKVRRMYHFNKDSEHHIILTVEEPGFLILVNKTYKLNYENGDSQKGTEVKSYHFHIANISGINFCLPFNANQEIKAEFEDFSVVRDEIKNSDCKNDGTVIDIEVIINTDNGAETNKIVNGNHNEQADEYSDTLVIKSETEYHPNLKKICNKKTRRSNTKNKSRKNTKKSRLTNNNLDVIRTKSLVVPCDNKENSTNNDKTHSEASYYCKVCSTSFSKLNALQKHTSKNHHENLDPDHLEDHLQTHNKKRNKTAHKQPELFECDECGYITIEQEQFTAHEQIHNNMYKCNICQFSTASSAYFQAHMGFHNTRIVKQELDVSNNSVKEQYVKPKRKTT